MVSGGATGGLPADWAGRALPNSWTPGLYQNGHHEDGTMACHGSHGMFTARDDIDRSRARRAGEALRPMPRPLQPLGLDRRNADARSLWTVALLGVAAALCGCASTGDHSFTIF